MPDRRRACLPWAVIVGVALIMLTIGGIAIAASDRGQIEPLPGVYSEMPDGWTLSDSSGKYVAISDDGDPPTYLVPEQYEGHEDGFTVADEAANIELTSGSAEAQCESQHDTVDDFPAPESMGITGGFADQKMASGTLARGTSTVDGRETVWILSHSAIAGSWFPLDSTSAVDYPNYSASRLFTVCVKDIDLVATFLVSAELVEASSKNSNNPPTAERNASVPEAREEVHEEIDRRYESNIGAMIQFFENVSADEGGGPTELDSLPTSIEKYDESLVDPFQGELEDTLGSAEPTASSSSSPEPTTFPTEEERYEEFGRVYDEAVRSEDWEETYSMLDEYSQQEFTEEEWVAKQQALRDASGPLAPLESVNAENDDQVDDSPWTVTLYYEDGTQDVLKVMIPMAITDPSDDTGPQRILTDDEIRELEQVSIPSSSSTNTTELEAEAEEAAGKYYMAAGLENWDYTYENLDASTQSRFTREEWIKKNQWFADNGSVLYHIDAVERQGGTQGPIVEVSLTLTYEDGSSSTRTTYFVYEDGEWKHRFSQEETDIFMPDASYEKFVAARE